MDTPEFKTRRPRRSKADIEEAIKKAAVSQIKKRGFSLALVTDIVRKAKIEPIVFYNRYKNLEEFYGEFVKSYDYWLSDLVRDSIREVETEEGWSNIIERLMTSLLSDDIMAELLRWEIAEGNQITTRTSRLRELHAIDLINTYTSLYKNNEVDVATLSALVVAGIYYIILHKDRSTFAGIDINTVEGKARVHKAIRTLASLLFRERENERLSEQSAEADNYRRTFEAACRERVEADYRAHVESLMLARQGAERRRIAAAMRMEGIPEDVINRCVNPIEVD